MPPTTPACSAALRVPWRSPGASIVDARIHTMTNGMALDTFWVQDASGGAFDQSHRLAKLSVLVEQALSGHLRLHQEIPKLTQAMGRRMLRHSRAAPRRRR